MTDGPAAYGAFNNDDGSLNTREEDRGAPLPQHGGDAEAGSLGSNSKLHHDGQALLGAGPGAGSDEVTSFNFFGNKSHTAVLAAGFVLAFDYSVIIISLQSAWHIVRPQSPELYGFAFGLYDLAQFLFTPIMSALSDIVGIKPTLVIAVLLNVIGNVIYAFVMYAGGHHGEDSKGEEIVGTWYLIIIGRFVAGIGSSAMGLGVIYFTVTSKISERTAALNGYRSAQVGQGNVRRVYARMGAPFISFALLGLTQLGSDSQLLWNFYTIPTWIAAMLGFVALLLVVFLFKEPKRREHKKVHVWDIDRSKAPNLIYHTAIINVIHLLATICSMTVYSQLFAFAVGEYHIVPYATSLWLLYIGVGPGVLAARFVVKKLHAEGWTDKEFALAGLGSWMVAYMLLPSYATPPPQALFYAGTACFGFSFMFYFPNIESFFTKKVTIYEHEAQGNLGFFTSGRFLGPFIGGFILQLHQSSYAPLYEYCPNFDSERAQSDQSYIKDCYHNVTQAPGGQDTCILGYPLRFFEKGCDLDNTFVLFIFAGIMAITMVYLRFKYFVEHGEHLVNDDSADRSRTGGSAPRSSLEEHLLADS